AHGRAPRLYLGEHQRVPVEGDHVDLAMTRAHVAREHLKAEPLQVRRGERLTEAAQLPARVTAGSVILLGGAGLRSHRVTLAAACESAVGSATRARRRWTRSGGQPPRARGSARVASRGWYAPHQSRPALPRTGAPRPARLGHSTACPRSWASAGTIRRPSGCRSDPSWSTPGGCFRAWSRTRWWTTAWAPR